MDRSRIPNRLKKYRRIAGYSQKQVATKLGLYDTNRISRWEKGYCLPEITTLLKLSILYNVLPHVLYEELCDILKDNLASHNNLPVCSEERFIR